ncbi:extracellular solute-binding protein [uncultured Acetatifactor sp.]|jgi:ABC-type glycerol-3-phosphate transport system substrate-binding protein|uniref:extracellular solute-binding protein n=1 Tax=uncultured Acetatifactor sp. TaxID=1671927 RepID=UPI00260755CB|nr:extracellular solute-binding protein [uncultured Acetatifactor sp.]
MKLMKNKAICRRVLGLALSAAMALSLAACGNSSGGETEKKEWVWVPEFITIDDETVSFYDMQLVGDSLCYQSYDYDEETEISTQSICRYSLADGNITKTPLNYVEEKNWNLNRLVYAQDGSMYGTTNVYNEDYTKSETFLCKFDAEGKQIFAEDMTELVAESYVDNMAIDGEGRIYVTGENNVWLFDADGNKRGTVSLGADVNWIRAMGSGKDGKMYLCYYTSNGDTVLCDIDFDGKKTGNTYENYPSSNSNALVPGIDKDFLAQDGNRVYEYDTKSQTSTELFTWLDSDINGNTVENFWGLEDGRILAVASDWETNEKSIALLTKTKASEVPQKETIVIGSLYGGSDIQAAAVKFNKSNDKYRISIKGYLDFNSWDGDDYEAYMADGMTRLNNDITSNNCPDILDLSGLNIKQLAAKGVFEDLNGYLEKSEKLSREDFLENILEAYTLDGKLVSIPYGFQMSTVVGKGSEVGTEMGWTLEELIAYADAHPDALLFDSKTKDVIMMTLMAYNADYFIDWSTGECRFDSEEFKDILNFANRFPEEYDWEKEDVSTPNKIQKGQVLLYEENIYDFNELQMCNEIFQGDASYIGYPTMDGSVGCMLSASQAYAITSKSGHKDGAWEFIEGFLTKEENPDRGFSSIGFPTMKSKLNAMAADAVEVKYYTDENGELYYDENGEPIVMGGGSSISYGDGWSYEYSIPTQEEVDLALSLMEIAKPVSYSQGDEVLNIINEEAAPFYKGQKSVDEVASVIQSRIKIYVGENK